MRRPTVHFVYTVPLGRGLIRRALDKALRIARLTPLHRTGSDTLIPWQHPIRAPHSISYNVLHALRRRADVRMYSIYEKGAIRLDEGDVFIGQPVPRGGFAYENRPDADDVESVTSATLRAYKGSAHRKVLMMPYANDTMLVSWAKDLAEHYADGIVLIGGAIWTRHWQDTPFGSIEKEKTLRLDMGIDMNDYPRVKAGFNPAGKRRFLYVGHTGWYKNTRELERIAARMPEYTFAHIGAGDIPGWKKVSNFANLTPEFMSRIAHEYDIFISTSTADAQATTVLEHMCFGFAVACTPETGYEYPSIVKLSVNDTEANVAALRLLQNEPESNLLERAAENRRVVASRHSWGPFCDAVVEFALQGVEGSRGS